MKVSRPCRYSSWHWCGVSARSMQATDWHLITTCVCSVCWLRKMNLLEVSASLVSAQFSCLRSVKWLSNEPSLTLLFVGSTAPKKQTQNFTTQPWFTDLHEQGISEHVSYHLRTPTLHNKVRKCPGSCAGLQDSWPFHPCWYSTFTWCCLPTKRTRIKRRWAN